jgi:chemotaxis protein MotB
MWLITSVSKEQRAAIFDYFKNPSMEEGKSVKPAPGQMGPGGASTSVINLGGGLDARRSSTPLSTGLGTPRQAPTPVNKAAEDEAEAQRIIDAADHKKLESLEQELRQAIDQSQALKPFKDQLLLDITPEGLRIQIVDSQNRPMFDLGSAKLKDYTGEILRQLAPYLNTVDNHVSLSGHTDVTPYVSQAGYNNWDLSADRANAARRALEHGGMAPEKIARIVGLSSSVLFDKDNARNPINRRISIIVMTKRAEEAAMKTDTSTATESPAVTAPPPAPVNPAAAAPAATTAPAPSATAVPPAALAAPAQAAPAAAH